MFIEAPPSLVGVPKASMAVVTNCWYCFCTSGGSRDGWWPGKDFGPSPAKLSLSELKFNRINNYTCGHAVAISMRGRWVMSRRVILPVRSLIAVAILQSPVPTNM